MSTVLSIRIPRELKRKMEALSDIVDWKAEIIKFIEEKVKYYEKMRILQEVEQVLSKHRGLRRGTAAGLVREDRDSS